MTTTMTFEEYMLDWWQNAVTNEFTDEECNAAMECFLNPDVEISDYVPSEYDTVRDYLLSQDDANEIYRTFFGYDALTEWKKKFDTEDFLREMIASVTPDDQFEFAQEFLDIIAYHAEAYSTPQSFFKDLHTEGCSSGLIGNFIYNIDCRDTYIKHIDDLEEFKAELDEEYGETILNKYKLPHYTFICWLCFEEFAHRIASALFPDEF